MQATTQRLVTLDFIRGIAVLGILMMNIQFFSQPMSAYGNPTSYGDFTGANFWVWLISHLIFDQKFMSIFSILFGVGIMIFSDNISAKSLSPRRYHYIRMVLLLGFGLIHGFFIWSGDILVSYALCGMIVYWFRHARSRTLLIISVPLLLIFWLMLTGIGALMSTLPNGELAQEVQASWHPTVSEHQQEINAYNGSWSMVSEQRITHTLLILSDTFLYYPRIIALMLIGMALYKTGLIKGHKSQASYRDMGFCFTLLGWMITAFGIHQNLEHQFAWDYSMFYGVGYNYWGSVFSALGYISLLIWLSQYLDQSVIKRALTNVGRMAFTNYILQSLICTSIIYGYGFALFGALSRVEQVIMVIAVWVFLLLFSSIWLQHFRFGPLEWLWRSLTYFSWQPIGHQK
ncbi:DUF418 domain-containing protein [Marinomonas agarivorans]|nr:DUF418 domain-containing protein [Marinomonas agarivorans]